MEVLTQERKEYIITNIRNCENRDIIELFYEIVKNLMGDTLKVSEDDKSVEHLLKTYICRNINLCSNSDMIELFFYLVKKIIVEPGKTNTNN